MGLHLPKEEWTSLVTGSSWSVQVSTSPKLVYISVNEALKDALHFETAQELDDFITALRAAQAQSDYKEE